MNYIKVLIISLVALATLGADAQRVVSLLPSATYTAAQIGADANIIGRTSYCPQPADGTKSKVVGDAMTVNVEAIMSLSPDVVIVSPFTAANVVTRLKSLKINIVSLPTPKDFDEICNQAITIGELTGHKTQAEALVAKEHANVAAIVASVKNTNNAGVYFQIGTKPIWGATPDYFINDIAAHLGAKNVLKVGEGACSRESVLSRKPDLIVISTLGGLGDGEAALWQKLTKAKIVLVDENILCCPTPVFFRTALSAIVDAINK